jgi:ATP-dependent DNA helicase RecG
MQQLGQFNALPATSEGTDLAREWVQCGLSGDFLGTCRAMTGSHGGRSNSLPRRSRLRGADSPPSATTSSPPSAPGSPPAGDSPPPDADWPPELWMLASPARGRHLRRDALASLIEQLCAGRWHSTRQLAGLLGRQPDNLQTKVLAALVREGRLELRHPAVPNRPDQAYRAAGTVERP